LLPLLFFLFLCLCVAKETIQTKKQPALSGEGRPQAEAHHQARDRRVGKSAVRPLPATLPIDLVEEAFSGRDSEPNL